jgi:hypothetical protein
MEYTGERTLEQGRKSTTYLRRRASKSSSSPTATPTRSELVGCLTTGGRAIEVEDVGIFVSCEGLSDAK